MATSTPAAPTTFNPIARAVSRLFNLHTWRGQFMTLLAAIVVLALLCTWATYSAFADTQSHFQRVAADTTPSILAAQDMQQAAQQIDASISDYLLTGDATSGIAQKVHTQDVTDIATAKTAFRDGLYRATRNITFADEERAVPEVSRLYDMYSARVDEIIYAYTTAGRDAAYKIYFDPATSPAVILGDASTQNSLTGQIAALEQVNRSALNTAAYDGGSAIGYARVISTLLGVVLLAALTLSAVLLVRRTHRVINPLTLPALLVALFFVITINTTLDTAHTDYSDATVNAFPSIDVAVQIKALATDANADESRWLIANQSQQSPDQSVRDAAIKRTADAQEAFRTKQASLDTQLQSAEANVTYPGENEALTAMVRAINCYRYLDGQIRTFYQGQQNGQDISIANPVLNVAYLGSNTRGTCPEPADKAALGGKADVQAAIRLDVGQSNDTFAQFIAATDSLKRINSDHFQASVNNANGYLGSYRLLCLLVFPLVALVGAAGIMMRLRDF